MSGFGWSYPPGCTYRHIDEAFGTEGRLDCPICNDGVEMDGPDCPNHRATTYTTCPKHGCIVCQDLEMHPQFACHFDGLPLNPSGPFLLDDFFAYCGPECRDQQHAADAAQQKEKSCQQQTKAVLYRSVRAALSRMQYIAFRIVRIALWLLS